MNKEQQAVQSTLRTQGIGFIQDKLIRLESNTELDDATAVMIIKASTSSTALKRAPDTVIVGLIRSIFADLQRASTAVPTGTGTVMPLVFGKTNYLPIQLNTLHEILPSQDDKLLRPIKWYLDSNKGCNYVIEFAERYEKVESSLAGVPDVMTAMISGGRHDKCIKMWEDRLVEMSNIMTETWNNALMADADKSHVYYAQVIDAVQQANIPMIMFELFQVGVNCIEQEGVDAAGHGCTYNIWQSISIVNKDGSRATYYDYVNKLIEGYGTYCFAEIAEPKIFSNAQKAFNGFDCSKYAVSTPTPLAPAWEEFFSKFTADEMHIYLAWIWGVVFADNSSRSLLYIYDPDGYSGKSAFANAMTDILGRQLVASIQRGSLDNQFAFAKIWAKRLIIYPDCKNTHIMQAERTHQITGSDGADVEDKGKRSFSVRMQAKMLINANVLPEINPKYKHERSRIILLKPQMTDAVLDKIALKDEHGHYRKDCTGEVITIGDHSFVQKLIDGAESMLINAYQWYQQLCPHDADYIVPDSVLLNTYDLDSADAVGWDALFDRLYTVDNNATMTRTELYNAYMTLCTEESKYRSFGSTMQFGNFKNYLEKDKHIALGRTANGSRVYKGIKLRSGTVPDSIAEYSSFAPKARPEYNMPPMTIADVPTYKAPAEASVPSSTLAALTAPVPPAGRAVNPCDDDAWMDAGTNIFGSSSQDPFKPIDLKEGF